TGFFSGSIRFDFTVPISLIVAALRRAEQVVLRGLTRLVYGWRTPDLSFHEPKPGGLFFRLTPLSRREKLNYNESSAPAIAPTGDPGAAPEQRRPFRAPTGSAPP